MPIESPCTKLCELDPRTRWCLGCGRTALEIGRWPDASDAERRAILRALPPRMAELASRGSTDRAIR
jgi:predicted Fe-S protein YdhL (DUF1289 family)